MVSPTYAKKTEGGVMVTGHGRTIFFSREEAIALQGELAEAVAEPEPAAEAVAETRRCRTCRDRFVPDPLNRNSDLCKKCLSEGRL